MGTTTVLDPDQQFQYLSSTMQIYNPARNLCLDDGGNEVLGTTSSSAILSFRPCDSSSINQQFIMTTGGQIYNPNWPNNQVCLFGNGNNYNGYQELLLWGCSTSNPDMIFNIIPICPIGDFADRQFDCKVFNGLLSYRPVLHGGDVFLPSAI